MLVLVAPGQGAQTPGFLTPWLELPGFRNRLHWLGTCAGLDLVRFGTEADADEIRDTAVTQPLLVAASLVSALALFPHPVDAFRKVGAVAGHSVGEIAAAAGAGVISAEQAMVFVRERGEAMAAAADRTPTGMTAVLGGEQDAVLAKLEEYGLTPANINGAGQVVAAGAFPDLEKLKGDPPEGARLRPLQVAGAFHTSYMGSAVDGLRAYASAMTTRDPRTRVLSNYDGSVVHSGTEVLDRVVEQVAAPVRWDQVMGTMSDLGVTAVIEMPPAGTLTGLIKRALPGVETLALKTPDGLPRAKQLVEEHGEPSPLENQPTWRLVVAPAAGTFRRGDAEPGSTVPTGGEIGSLVARRNEQPITARHGGTVVEWLVEDGDPVSPGQPLVRLHPEVSS
ncbi:MAG: acyltransferase domain-containing protein [Streptosporangiales bacterium]|nr:acyltransferase domain-containing protein [Streptosporangiales bacterium]